MLMVALMVLMALAVWFLCAVGLALLAGGIISERDRRDTRLSGLVLLGGRAAL